MIVGVEPVVGIIIVQNALKHCLQIFAVGSGVAGSIQRLLQGIHIRMGVGHVGKLRDGVGVQAHHLAKGTEIAAKIYIGAAGEQQGQDQEQTEQSLFHRGVLMLSFFPSLPYQIKKSNEFPYLHSTQCVLK